MPLETTTVDAATNLHFFESQLENQDTIMHQPIVAYTWSRDIKVRTLNLTDKFTSFIRSDFGASSTNHLGTIPWISTNTTAIPSVSITGEKVLTPVRLAAQLISYSILDLETAQRLKVPLDRMQLDALHAAYQLGIDQMVYVGDSTLNTSDHKCEGLLNSSKVAKEDSPNKFNSLTPDEIVDAINMLIQRVWQQTGYTMMPDTIIMPPLLYAQLYNTKYSDNADVTLMTYIKKNCLGGMGIEFRPVHWAATAASDGSGRIMAYINDLQRVRFNMAPITSTKTYEEPLRLIKPYVWALGEVEFVYPECAFYLDKVCDAPEGYAAKFTSATKTAKASAKS